MEHYYKTLEGNFTFPDYYSWVAAQMVGRRSPRLVEVGCLSGQSAAFLGVELINRGIKGKLDLVDVFTYGGTKAQVLANLAPIAEVLGDAHECLSWDGAAKYEDHSLDFVFIDANHALETVSRDIDSWRHKVRRGGILGGHDFCAFENFGVMQAVNERFARFEVWPGITYGGDAQMQGKYWPCWSVFL